MWSRMFDVCVVCGRNDRPYCARGKCSYCYSREYQSDPQNAERVAAQKRDFYLRSGGNAAAKARREEWWFNNMRQVALDRDGHKCVRCGCARESALIVHHKDGNGRGSANPNNDLGNLETLCRACHARHHGQVAWSRDFPYCRACGTTERRHNAKGLCWKCYKLKK